MFLKHPSTLALPIRRKVDGSYFSVLELFLLVKWKLCALTFQLFVSLSGTKTVVAVLCCLLPDLQISCNILDILVVCFITSHYLPLPFLQGYRLEKACNVPILCSL